MNAEAKPLKCGLIMPISAIDGCSEAHWDEVRVIIKEALAETPFVVELVSDSNEIGIIQKRIVQNIYDNEIVVCDVSAKNPNVMFELGMRLAFDKPAIIIKDDKTNYSFDTSPIEHLQYPRDLHYHAIQAFKIKLREKIVATHEASKGDNYTTFLKNFGQFVVAKIDERPVGKEEYILEAISELRSEVRAIAKIRQSKDYISIIERVPGFSAKSKESSSGDFRIETEEDAYTLAFVIDFLAKNSLDIKFAKNDKNTIKKMAREYVEAGKNRPFVSIGDELSAEIVLKMMMERIG